MRSNRCINPSSLTFICTFIDSSDYGPVNSLRLLENAIDDAALSAAAGRAAAFTDAQDDAHQEFDTFDLEPIGFVSRRLPALS